MNLALCLEATPRFTCDVNLNFHIFFIPLSDTADVYVVLHCGRLASEERELYLYPMNRKLELRSSRRLINQNAVELNLIVTFPSQ